MNVLAIGSSNSVEHELALVDRDAFDVVLGINRAAKDFGPVDYHITLHPEEYASSGVARVVSNRAYKGVKIVFPSLWRLGGTSGSSGLYAVRFALCKLQADNVVLAGVGMSHGPHYYNPSFWHMATRFQRTWREVLPQLRGRVYSLGGWTAEILNDAYSVAPPGVRQHELPTASRPYRLKETHHV